MDQYELGNEKTWPENGTLNYNTILQLGVSSGDSKMSTWYLVSVPSVSQ